MKENVKIKSLKVSVIMSVHNGEKYLRKAIESILNQTFRDFEFIIVNDGSIDKTEDILDDYAKQDSRIKIIKNRNNIGLTKSLNKAIQKAKVNILPEWMPMIFLCQKDWKNKLNSWKRISKLGY